MRSTPFAKKPEPARTHADPEQTRPASVDVTQRDEPEGASFERWSLAVHVETKAQRALSLWAAFDRRVFASAGGDPVPTHGLSFALADESAKRYRARQELDAARLRAMREAITRGETPMDRGLARAALEMLDAGALPAPEHVMFGEPAASARGLELRYGGSLFSRRPDGSYRLVLGQLRGARGCDLRLRALKPGVVLHEATKNMPDEAGASLHYALPSCFVDGTIFLDGEELVVSGLGHYDRVIGPPFRASACDASMGSLVTQRAFVHLDDGSSVVVQMSARAGAEPTRARAIVMDVRGHALVDERASLAARTTWQSTRSYREYPVSFTLEVPAAGLELVLETSMVAQEIASLIASPPAWRGRARASGTRWGRPIAGIAWIEQTFPPAYLDLGGFFSAVRRGAQHEITSLVSRSPSQTALVELIGCVGREESLEGVDPVLIGRSLTGPLLDVIDRGGKAWRSFVTLACIDATGGDSTGFSPWLAIPELIHTGSLLVDDVQDGSTIRRGGPACHLVHGEAIAINSGTAAYFLAELFLSRCPLPPERAQRVLFLYFEAMRAGHGGQALDIAGLGELLPAAVDTGDIQELAHRVAAINRLKTAAPVGALARMGAIAGGGTEAQVEGLGAYVEAVGMAFQLIDDVLNLRGFQGDLKQRGEDLRIGKVTMPVVRALGSLDRRAREQLWQTLRDKPDDDALVEDLIEQIERTGALDACVLEARHLVEEAWRRVDPLLPPSVAKARLRALGWYVLERNF
ncbi:polyprenyl synthetase family protein [Polyangium sp. 6x1]|uniref:polyprenyl synthetase family protein n=1 Tax=Polyangium sp. 6x1 TaxID=3042689 RepID=UPI0024822433|nr:polyprenyl synthetase family protein [Polyangium sp. 6x1]MDI1442606.1 polyprenyl synthetase family protein [Polyangium sp. 6x1]